MLRLSDFISSRKRFYNLSRGSVSQLQNTVDGGNLEHTFI